MDEHQRERYQTLTRELLRLGPGLMGVVQDMIRNRSFAAERATVVSAIDVMAEIADALVPLDAAVQQEGRRTSAAIRERVVAEREEHSRQVAAEHEARRQRMRRDLEAAALRGGAV